MEYKYKHKNDVIYEKVDELHNVAKDIIYVRVLSLLDIDKKPNVNDFDELEKKGKRLLESHEEYHKKIKTLAIQAQKNMNNRIVLKKIVKESVLVAKKEIEFIKEILETIEYDIKKYGDLQEY